MIKQAKYLCSYKQLSEIQICTCIDLLTGVMINKAQYEGNPLSNRPKDHLWEIVRNRNRLSHELNVNSLELHEMRRVNQAWAEIQKSFQGRVPKDVIQNMTELQRKYE